MIAAIAGGTSTCDTSIEKFASPSFFAKCTAMALAGAVFSKPTAKKTISRSGDRFASSVVAALEDAGLDFRDLRTEQPNLEDVFLALTGREMRG